MATNYGYYSRVLNKPFDSIEELEAAEAEFTKAEAEKKAKAEAKRAEAHAVEEAWKAMNEAKTVYNQEIVSAREAYLSEVKAAQDKFEAAKEAAATKCNTAIEKYNKELKLFVSKHPEGYHVTLKDGDREIVLASSGNRISLALDDLFDSAFSNLFRF